MESSIVYGDENSFQHQNSDRASAMSSTVSKMRRGVSQALLVDGAAGDVTRGFVAMGVAEKLVAGS